MSTTEDKPGSRGPSLENREYGWRDPLCWSHNNLYPQKLALTSLTSRGPLDSIVRSWTKATKFVFFPISTYKRLYHVYLHPQFSLVEIIKSDWLWAGWPRGRSSSPYSLTLTRQALASTQPYENLLGDFNAKVGREDIFKPTIGIESVHEIGNDNGVRVVNLPTSKNLRVKSTMFPHRNIHKYTWTSPDGKPTIRLTIFW
jgi:hypothetical protein